MRIEAEFNGEFAGPGFGGDPTVGAGFDGETSFADGFDEAAEPIRRFEQDRFDWRAVAGEACEFVGGGEAGDASSDDGHTLHVSSGARFEVTTSTRASVRRDESLRDSGR